MMRRKLGCVLLLSALLLGLLGGCGQNGGGAGNAMCAYSYDAEKQTYDLCLPAGEGWVRLKFAHETKPLEEGKRYENRDVWRFRQAASGMLEQGSDGSLSFRAGQVFATGGAWEAAVYVDGQKSAVGPYHGYEKDSECAILVDGEALTQPAENVPLTQCKTFEITTKGQLFKFGTKDEAVADLVREYKVQAGGFTLHQQYTWKVDGDHAAYLAMLPILRNTKEGVQITDQVTTDMDKETYDVSVAGHSTPVSQDTEGVRKATISGEESGITAEISVDFDNLFHVDTVEQYNKLYFRYGDGQPDKAGDVWDVNAAYSFQCAPLPEQAPAAEAPAQEKTPAETQPAEEQPAETPAAEETPAEAQTEEQAPAEGQAEEQTAEETPAEEQTT